MPAFNPNLGKSRGVYNTTTKRLTITFESGDAFEFDVERIDVQMGAAAFDRRGIALADTMQAAGSSFAKFGEVLTGKLEAADPAFPYQRIGPTEIRDDRVRAAPQERTWEIPYNTPCDACRNPITGAGGKMILFCARCAEERTVIEGQGSSKEKPARRRIKLDEPGGDKSE